MNTAELLLGFLAAGPRHGYELKHTHDGHFPRARPLAYGQVYATLGRLERDGLVEVVDVAAGGGPDRTVYAPTPLGTRRLHHWLEEVEPPSPHVSSVLLAKVVVSLLVGGSARDYLRRQRAAHLARMRELTAVKADLAAPLTDRLAADFAVAHLDADLRWMQTTTQRLDELAREVRP